MEFCLSRCLSLSRCLCFSLYLCLWLCLWQQLQLRLRLWLRFVRFFFQAATCLATLRYVTYLCIHTLRMRYNVHTHTRVHVERRQQRRKRLEQRAVIARALLLCCAAPHAAPPHVAPSCPRFFRLVLADAVAYPALCERV